MSANLTIEVWSDVACPWCFVGKRQLEAALAEFPQAGSVHVRWRAFELDPGAPAERDGDYAEHLGKKYGVSTVQARAMLERMTRVAGDAGLDFHFERIRPGSTFDAHRLLHLARERGLQGAVKERLLQGYFAEGEAIGTAESLTRLATQAGLAEDEVASVLASDAYAREVREDQARARELGITGVPFFVIGRFAVSGAQPPAALRSVLDKAWSETSTE